MVIDVHASAVLFIQQNVTHLFGCHHPTLTLVEFTEQENLVMAILECSEHATDHLVISEHVEIVYLNCFLKVLSNDPQHVIH